MLLKWFDVRTSKNPRNAHYTDAAWRLRWFKIRFVRSGYLRFVHAASAMPPRPCFLLAVLFGGTTCLPLRPSPRATHVCRLSCFRVQHVLPAPALPRIWIRIAVFGSLRRPFVCHSFRTLRISAGQLRCAHVRSVCLCSAGPTPIFHDTVTPAWLICGTTPMPCSHTVFTSHAMLCVGHRVWCLVCDRGLCVLIVLSHATTPW